MAGTDAPAPPDAEAPEEPKGPSAEELDKLYGEATELFAALWPMSRGKSPWEEAKAARAGAVVSEIEKALRDSVGDYEELTRLHAQDQRTMSAGLRLKADEVIYRNLMDVQADLKGMLARR